MFFKKQKTEIIYAPCDGKIVPLNEVPDQVFSDKILGDGAAILPESSMICSPVNGKITQLFDTLHAYAITSENGIELLIHIGLNTVELKGEGFKACVKEGDNIKTGDKLADVNLEYIADRGYNLHTPIIITNISKISSLDISFGNKKQGDEIITCKIK